jgi:hypothetical protein
MLIVMPFSQLRAAAAVDLSERIVLAGVALAIAAVSVQSVAHLANELVLSNPIQLLDADGEGTALAWAASVAIFAGGMASAIHALVLEGRNRRRAIALSVVLVYLSLDEIISIHERLGTAVGKDLLGLPSWADVRLWLVIYLPLLFATLVMLLDSGHQASGAARRAIFVGAGALVAAIVAEGVGLLTKWLEERGTDLPDILRITIEEAAELAGWILIATGLTAAAVAGLLRARDTEST